MRSLSTILFTLLLSFSTLATGGAYQPEEEVPKTPVEFGVQTAQINGEFYLSLNYKNFPHWHTYWKNPGDAGLPISSDISVDGKEIKLEQLEWPVPKRYIEKGDILAFGYDGFYSLFYKLPKEALNGSAKIHSTWLVCKHICIPGQATIEGNFANNIFETTDTKNLTAEGQVLESRFNQLPKLKEFPAEIDLILAKDSNPNVPSLILFYNLSDVSADQLMSNMNLLTPYPISPFSFKREELFKDKKNNVYAKYKIEWDGEYVEPVIPYPSNGKLDRPYKLKFLYADPKTKEVSIVEKTFTTVSLDQAEKTESFFSLVQRINNQVSTDKKIEVEQSDKVITSDTSESGGNTFLYYLLLAFIGGLILNFMPCVLPVISLKLFGLIRHSDESRASIFKHNLFYSLGVLATFLALAAVVVAVKAAGANIGWGFQLQSPPFVAIMVIVIFVMALNLFGLFEVRTPGGSKLGNVEIRNTYSGDFLSGILATILSTPCSAPFLGTALTFAFTSSTTAIVLVFLSIGLGLSFPFLLTGIFPKLIAFLPRPGHWMEHLKKFLALTLILTVIWLLDVYGALTTSSIPLLKLNTTLVLIFFSIYMLKHITKRKLFVLPFAIVTIALAANVLLTKETPVIDQSVNQIVLDKRQGGLDWEEWSEAKMNSSKEQKQLTFVDFTAKWCFTCKVNEKLVIDTASFHELVKKKNVKLLLADWTRRDEKIGSWLKKNGMVGVPAYFVINSKGELINLGETLSIKELEKTLN
ncbi:thioredoxin family protein [Halobacteriovorax sp. GB3]|uniref:protein-disulfide reductase DsbD family protein n=1 Tax=Halobacteriovorax sp. GB3 TaxID=2719615 RepID=UPI002361553D|nr:thioredoxin family protein [Halobacteriovorax sp. GB3]MDD0853686.1 thioredoxin family protein [Halobacteriovorax sp. GB3]